MAFDPRILDTSIVRSGGKIDLTTPVNIYTSLQANKRAQRLSDLTLSNEEKKANKQLKLKEIMQGSINPNGTMNGKKAIMDLNRGGFIDEAFGIQKRMDAAESNQLIKRASADKLKAASQKAMGMAALTVSEAENPVEAFEMFRAEGIKNKWPLSKGVLNYFPTEEELADGGLDPRVMQEMKYHGSRSLTPNERIARAKAGGVGAEEWGLKPIYGKRDGETVAFQTSKRGGIREIELPQGVELAPGVTYKDVGDKIGIYDKSGALISTIAKGIAPEKKEALRYKGLDAEIKGAKEARDVEAFQAKRIEVAKKAVSYKKANQGAIDSIEEFLDKAEGVFESPDLGGVTGLKAGLRLVPGTDYADLDADLKYLISSGVINTMRELKEKSPTGSTGFGALSEKEMGVLENAFSTLSNRRQSPKKMKGELNRIINKMKKALREQREIFRNSNSLLGEEKTVEQTIDDEIEGL